jgi:ATP-dependent DNA helicase RecG
MVMQTRQNRNFQNLSLPLPRLEVDSGAASKLLNPLSERITGQVTGQVAGEVLTLLKSLKGEMFRAEIQRSLRLKGLANFRVRYLLPALSGEFIETTIPDKPNSRLQKYRLSEKGKLTLGIPTQKRAK